MNDLLQFLGKEWKTLISAPFTFVSFFALSGTAAFLLVKYRYESVIDTLRERIQGKDDQLSIYRERLHLVKDNTSFSILGNKELKEKAFDLISNIKEFIKRRHNVNDQIMNSYSNRRSGITEEESNKQWDIHVRSLTTASDETAHEYDRRFKTDTIILRDELLSRLPKTVNRSIPYKDLEFLNTIYERPQAGFAMEEIVKDLEILAKHLPDEKKSK